MIGLIVATIEEYEALQAVLGDMAQEEKAGLTFLTGEMAGQEVVGVKAGIGKVNAALCTQMLIDMYQPQAIINVGVAGALNANLAVGDVVISRDTVQHDMDTTFFGDEPGFISGLGQIYFPADEKLIHQAQAAAEKLGLHYLIGRIVTGDQFIAKAEKKEWLIQQFAGDCTEMEGGAVAHVCTVNKVPFVIIRAISDGASDGAPMQYEEFVKLAAGRAMNIIKEILQKG